MCGGFTRLGRRDWELVESWRLRVESHQKLHLDLASWFVCFRKPSWFARIPAGIFNHRCTQMDSDWIPKETKMEWDQIRPPLPRRLV
jgi:hypothetical protein